MAKTVVIPLHFIRHGAVGGVENAIYNLVEGLSLAGTQLQLEASGQVLLSSDFVTACNARPNIRLTIRDAIPPWAAKRLTPRFARFFEEWQFARGLSGYSSATIFPNYFTPPSRMSRCGQRVCIVHDLQHRHFPQYFSASKRLWLEMALRSTFRFADKVVFISKAVLDDARREYPQFSSERWVSIPNAVSWAHFGAPDLVSPYDFPYILSVSHHYPHKNIETLVRAFAEIATRFPHHHLVLAGQIRDRFTMSSLGYGMSLDELAMSLGLSNRIHVTGYVPSQRLGTLYRHAECFALPSLFEGFGLPVIEAMGLGVPCIVSGIPALAEVTLGHALSVADPLSVTEWSEGLSMILATPRDETRLKRVAAEVFDTYRPEVVGARFMELL
ncbi:glycosyltransferase family 1 protein [Pleomorphomonas sp. JP5]|uniref:glycosyltransferase family 4 protein n=1 Tax=Pleomorphomonas sp. JP5 TaxID=2942998 RepID=UPI0020433891|nr:glycosyltransferase family 1 protein [Pleomorphomonas sp. JP5]MCM5559384.1 glycosyltransferase family 4 protein [Pleomorphomonas sp. JP5]